MTEKIKAFIDLTRLHFGPIWPLLFCSGAMLGFQTAGTFSWKYLIHVTCIGFFGGTGGIVLNDCIDREYDKKDVEPGGLTRYWRPFGSRPVARGTISPETGLTIFCLFTGITLVLIFFLPFPQSMYVAASLCYCYAMECFYQIIKRYQRFPIAQLLGRTDLSLFPAAGYMAVAGPAPLAFIYMGIFFPLAQAHLGVNDLADLRNDEARGMKSISILFGTRGTVWWIALFSVAHIALLHLLLRGLPVWTTVAMLGPACLLTAACSAVFIDPVPRRALRILPLVHATIALEAGILITAASLLIE